MFIYALMNRFKRISLALAFAAAVTCGGALPASAQAQSRQTFTEWLQDMRQEARRSGISQQTIDAALPPTMDPIQRVIELDRKQPEGTMTFARYRTNVVNNARIQTGRDMMKKHAAELEKASKKYGVPAQYIVALWAIETNFGGNTGGFDVVNALATLAWDGRRRDFFTKELLAALQILDEGHIAPGRMKGSWAGAMGQNQFMPSSFKSFAVDGDGDGKKDIWTNLSDVFASTANYLSRQGWKSDERWGREVVLPAGFSQNLVGLDVKKPLSEWRNLGVKLPGGGAIPVVAGMEGSLVAPDGVNGPVFLVYDNYRAIMRWNRSTYFATSVGLLANAIAQ